MLTLGLVGIAVPVCGFIAWYMAAKAMDEIRAGAPYTQDGPLRTGYLVGMVMSIITLVGIVSSVLLMLMGIGIWGAMYAWILAILSM